MDFNFLALVEDCSVKLSDIKWTSHNLCVCGIGTFVTVPRTPGHANSAGLLGNFITASRDALL